MTKDDLRLLSPRYLPTWCFISLLFPLAWCPWQLRRKLGEIIGRKLFCKNRKRQEIIRYNLTRCFPELDDQQRNQLSEQCFIEYCHAVLDYSLLFFRSRHWLLKRVNLHGEEQLKTALAQGDNLILLLGHSYWLEFATAAVGQNYPIFGLYKQFNNPVADRLIRRSRLKDVLFCFPREAGMRKLLRAFQPGRAMILVADEDLGLQHSVFADFFSTPKATLTTPARLCRLSQAKAMPIMAFFNAETGKYDVHIGQVLDNVPSEDSVADAAAMNKGWEALIRQQPGQYMWHLKLFHTQPEETSPYSKLQQRLP